jgi:hypothetical protein
MAEPLVLICQACQLQLVPQKTDFHYLGHNFYADILTCPGCRQVFIPEEMARGRMAEVEMQLEDK